VVSENTERSLANLIPWRPGQSPNPGGRPRGLVALVREQTRDGAELVEFMLRVLRAKRQPMRLRMEAAAWLADRGFGKALQQMELSSPGAEQLVIRVEYPDDDVHGDPA
jgi:Family of unknown function (DUF5681)